jgi:hypothetical protein
MTAPLEGPESRLVYSTDPRELPPVVRTHFTIRSLATAAHLATLGVYVEAFDGHWRVPITAKRDAIRSEWTFVALRTGSDRRARERKQQVTSYDRPK